MEEQIIVDGVEVSAEKFMEMQKNKSVKLIQVLEESTKTKQVFKSLQKLND